MSSASRTSPGMPPRTHIVADSLENIDTLHSYMDNMCISHAPIKRTLAGEYHACTDSSATVVVIRQMHACHVRAFTHRCSMYCVCFVFLPSLKPATHSQSFIRKPATHSRCVLSTAITCLRRSSASSTTLACDFQGMHCTQAEHTDIATCPLNAFPSGSPQHCQRMLLMYV